MITPLSIQTLELVDEGYEVKVENNELKITNNSTTEDVRINCIYTKDEINEIIKNNTPEEKEEFFKLRESEQLYLYKPSKITQSTKYYEMIWNIDSSYNIPPQTNFEFKDYLFGHTWALTWDGTSWVGNNVVNHSFNKQSTRTNNNGKPALVIQHTEHVLKWIKCIVDTVKDTDNYATILSKYVTNWRVLYTNGTVINIPDDNVQLDEAPSYDNIDVQQFIVKVNKDVSSKNMLYVLADINIDGYITPLKWDSNITTPIVSHCLNTRDNNPVIESFTYVREVKHSNKSTPEEQNKKDIHIYIEKEYFEQKPNNADETYNPFDIMITQQFYEVKPDPRNCTTLTTDKNIYSSKIIWADNIMTMRRDLNVVGGTVDVLAYDYSSLRAIINGIQEQLRLQNEYNDYIKTISDGLTIAGNILNILQGAVNMISDLSKLTLNDEKININTYRTEDFTFPGMGGGGYGGDDYPGGKKPISGKFLLDMDINAAEHVFKRFIPTQTEIPAATSTLTATELVLNALNSLTQIGDATTTIIAGGLTLNRLPDITQGVRTIQQSIHTITNSFNELLRRWRERRNNTIVDHTISNTTEMELDDLDELPINTLTHETTTNVATTTNTLFDDYTLESLSDLTNEELLALNSADINIQQIGNDLIFVTSIATGEVLYVRRCDHVQSITSPERIRFTNRRNINTTSTWSYDGRTALEIEQMLLTDRILFENTHPEIRFVRNSDVDTGVDWTEVRDSNNKTVAIIDITMLTRTSVGNDGINIQSHNNNVTVNQDGLHVETNTNELIANEYNVVVSHHELTPTTDGSVIIPNTTITLNDVEQMDWYARHRLTNENPAIQFRPHDATLDDSITEEYTEVLYSNNVIGVIDRRQLNQVSIDGNHITITNPHTSLTLTDHSIEWMTNHENQQQRYSLNGFLSNISTRFEEQSQVFEWLLDHPTLTDRYIVGRGSAVLVPLVDALLYIPRAIHKTNTFSVDGESIPFTKQTSLNETKISLKPLIDWCISTESDVAIPDDNNQAISLNSCINICKTFRDTVKGPLALLSYKIQEIEDNSPADNPVIDKTEEFDTLSGYDDYYVKHSDISVYEPTVTTETGVIDPVNDNVVIMKISLPTILKNKLLTSTSNTNVFKIHLRNLLIMDWLGNVLNDFIISVDDGSFICPQLTHNKARDCYSYSTRKRENPEIMFDKDLNIDPYTWYLNGDMTIHNLTTNDALVSRKPVIKCDIIDAQNALKLQKSDVYYFYRPTSISYNQHVKYIDKFGSETLEYECECYTMIYKIPESYEIPTNLSFKFKEYCFGNSWVLTWDGSNWVGDDIQGRFQGKIINKCNLQDTKPDNWGGKGCMIAVKHDTLNSRAVPENKTHGLAYSLLNECQNNGHYETLIQKRDGSIVKGSDFEISLGHSFMIYDAKLDGYDLVEIHCNQDHHSTSKIDLKDIELLYLDISLTKSSSLCELPNQIDVMRLSFTIKEKHPSGGINDSATIDIYGALDTIERIAYTWSSTSKNTQTDESGQTYSNRDIVLYLRHDYTDPIDEINWDPSTNAFEYIIKQQFYEVSPNPNASTTLYTDFNITSSKIITADNITTMRSDLNLVTNNVDVVSYDVKEVKSKVDALDSQMNEQQMKTKYLEKEVDKIDMKANVGIVLGAVGCVLGATGIGVAGKALSFATKGVEGVVKAGGRELVNTITKASDVGADVLEDMAGKLTDELPDIGFDTWFGDMIREVTTKSVKTRNVVSRNVLSSTDKLNNIISWCETEFTPVTNIKFTDELDDPSKIAMTLLSTMDLCKRYQHTMKPMIKTLSEGVKNGLSKNDLTRTDVIDVVGKIEDKHIKLFAEEVVYVRLCALNGRPDLTAPMISPRPFINFFSLFLFLFLYFFLYIKKTNVGKKKELYDHILDT
ncbi:hypothetical protein M9Y10_013814 [Tritrichomonas musculus]|uniref:Uncharacterized protein n=1 Tax=Tritrichomonas musculus TaxID=1915356 RepID=A0ABR2KXU4_9EUKA